MRSTQTRGKGLLALLSSVGAAYLLPLLAHSIIGLFTRYMADDFCMAALARGTGLIQAETYLYLTWSGRYSYLLLVDFASLVGPFVAPVLPGLLIVLWLAALSWSLLELAPWVRLSPLLAIVLATIIVSATLSAIPNVAQSLYWRNSSLTYTAPLIMGSLLAGIALRQSARASHPLSWLLVLGLAFLAGGFSEIYTALQLALFGLALAAALIAAWRRGRWRSSGPWLAGLLGSGAAVAAIALAPGTRVRQATFAAPPGIRSLAGNSFLYSRWFVRDAFLQQTPLLLAVAAACAIVAAVVVANIAEQRSRQRRLFIAALLAVPVITLGLLVVCYAPAFYALQYLPPDRVLIINWFVLISATAAWGFLAGWLAAPALQWVIDHWPRPALGAVLILFAGLVAVPPIAAAARAAGDLSAARSYASTWDSYDQMLTAAQADGGGTVTLARLTTPGGIDNLSDDPHFWTNQCVAQYYGVQVRAIAPPPTPSQADMVTLSPVQASIGGVAQVLGYHLDQTTVRAGQPLTVTVYWLPTANTDRPYTVFVHVYDPATGSLGQFDGYPGQGQYPTTLWIHGQAFADNYQVPIRPGARAAQATVILGLYDLETSQRLPVSGSDAGPPGQDWVQFGHVRVTP